MNDQLTIFKKPSQKKEEEEEKEGVGEGKEEKQRNTRDKDCKDWSLKQYEFEYVSILIG